jgi:HlyD family secretion protein
LLAPDPVPVRLTAVERGTVEETVTNSRAGTVTARRRAKLSPEIGGQVVEIPYREGDTVEAGAVVLRLDDRTQRAQLDLAGSELEAARAEQERACLAADRADRELQRMQRLADEQIVSTDLLDSIESARMTAEAACRTAQANSARAQAAVGVARTALSKTVLRSPFTGIVAEVAIEVGEWTTPSPPALPVPPVVDVLDPGSIYVSAPMDEVDSGRIHAGNPARVSVDSHPDETFVGEVARVAPYVLDVEEQNRTIEIEVDIDSRGERILPGTSADVEVILSVRADVLRVPTSALIEGGAVLVLDGELLAERKVETGLRNWDFTEITGGLEEGERIVVSLDREDVEAGALAVDEDASGEG